MTILAGTDQRIITPPPGKKCYLAGLDHNRSAAGTHDELECRVLALKQENTTVALVTLGLWGLSYPETQAIRQTLAHRGLDVELFISSSHTCHGPDTVGLWGRYPLVSSGVRKGYLLWLREQIVQSIGLALADLRPAWLKFGRFSGADLLQDWPDDGEHVALQVIALPASPVSSRYSRPPTWQEMRSGGTIATIVNWSGLPCVLGSQNRLFSNDYVYYLRKEIEATSGGVAFFIPGALGGFPKVKARSWSEAERIGREVAEHVRQALSQGTSVDALPLQVARLPLSIPVSNKRFKLALDLGIVQRPLQQGRLTSEVSLLRIGTSLWAGVPGELSPVLGRRLKRAMGDWPVIIGLCNDAIGGIGPTAGRKRKGLIVGGDVWSLVEDAVAQMGTMMDA